MAELNARQQIVKDFLITATIEWLKTQGMGHGQVEPVGETMGKLLPHWKAYGEKVADQVLGEDG